MEHYTRSQAAIIFSAPKNEPTRFSFKSAFTLIEVMVVLVIISIIMTFAVISLLPWWEKRQITEDVNQIANSMKYLQSRAILSDQYFAAHVNNDGMQFFEKKGEQWNSNNNLQNISWPDNVNINITVNDQAIDLEKADKQPQIIFFPTGNITPTTIRIGTSRIIYQININLAGNISLEQQNP